MLLVVLVRSILLNICGVPSGNDGNVKNKNMKQAGNEKAKCFWAEFMYDKEK
jgi:hypothetical protein